LNFTKSFTGRDADPTLDKKLMDPNNGVAEYVLSKMIEGLRRLIDNNFVFTNSPVNDLVLAEFTQQKDSLDFWVEDSEITRETFESKEYHHYCRDQFYEWYKTFCSSSGMKAFNKITFTNRLKVKFHLQTYQTYIGTPPKKYFKLDKETNYVQDSQPTRS